MYKLKIIVMMIFSCIASLATYPYGYGFVHLLPFSKGYLTIAIGCLFAASAGLANMILGFYSLFSVNMKGHKNNSIICLTSLLGAIPTFFFSFFGYRALLSNNTNLIISFIVFIVNTGINYTAIVNLLKSLKKLVETTHIFKINKAKTISCGIGCLIGALISMTAYLATADGIAQIALNYELTKKIALQMGSLLAILAWLPLGALYLNSTGHVTVKIYDFLSQSRFKLNNLSYRDVLLMCFVLLSGSAFARMTYDFYDPNHLMPAIFKFHYVQSFAYSCLVPLALISSAAVNYFALNAILSSIKKHY